MENRLSASKWEEIKKEIISRANDLFGSRLLMWLTHVLNLVNVNRDGPNLVVAGGDPVTGDAPPEIRDSVVRLITEAIGKINKPIVRLILSAFVANALPRILDSFWDSIFTGGPLKASGADLKASNLTEFGDLRACDDTLPEKVS